MRTNPLIAKTAAFVLMSPGALAAVAETGEEFFEKHVRPVLAEHCYECHSAEAKKLKGGLRLDTGEGIRKGGETGAAVVSGKPDESLLITAVRYHDKDLRMPPPKDDVPRKLADAQIADLVEWVRAGAPMPEDRRVTRDTRLPHWAFQPIGNPLPPEVGSQKSEVSNPIDRFILAKLADAGLQPAPEADPRTLIRRMTFDLTGLPPTPEEVEAFGAASIRDSQSAIRNLIDTLLASPRYGERWGRHWLDVARYSDTKGYVYGREEPAFVHAYAYRDWVVRAFNEDVPYDRFLLLQIAADQLVPPGSPDLAAMGFLTGGRRFIGVTRDIIDDRIDVVTRGTMALTAACARCHDHKFDPIPTRDYYSLYGVFRACAEQLVRIELAPAPTPEFEAFEKEYAKHATKFSEMMRKRRDEAAARLRARVGDYLAAQLELQKYPEEGFDQILTADDLIPHSVRRWRDFLHRNKDAFDPIFAPWHALAKLPADDFETKAAEALAELRGAHGGELNPAVAAAFASAPKTMREAAERYGKLFTDSPDEALSKFLVNPRSPTTVPDEGIADNELFFTTSACEELWKLQGEVDRAILRSPASPPHALIVVDRVPERHPRVFIRGNPARLGEEVPRQFLQVLAGPERQPFSRGSGRLELAQAIVRPDNPLTARVMVNRIWQHHFGTGLVRTASDFGLRAEPPSHPELLDWLAREFVKSGWSVKAMHRLIMSSAVYRRSAQCSEINGRQDADNRLLSHFNRERLDFEQMRDAMLAVSGELDTRIGGKPVELLAAANKRRTIYGRVDRQFLPGTFRVFDFANPDIHVAQRHTTTVPQQALFLLNHAFVAHRAKALAARADLAGAASREERARRLIRVLYQRPATDGEVASALRFIVAAEADAPPPPPKPVGTEWQYGWGEYDESAKRVKSFQPLPHFTGKAWQGGAAFPDAALGWVQLTADGGHPGNDLQHACIRRWTAPRDGIVSVSGEIVHEPDVGDGIRAFIISSRHGELKAALLHHSKAEMSATGIEVKQGDTLDFIVDIRGGLNSDQFLWAPGIAALEAAPTATWDAKKEFAGPQPAHLQPLQPWEQYAQVLLLGNEFSFVD